LQTEHTHLLNTLKEANRKNKLLKLAIKRLTENNSYKDTNGETNLADASEVFVTEAHLQSK
jgi:hypothetical protein